MAKADAKAKKEITMEEALWKSADKLRGSVEPAEYKHVVLSLFFLKFASDKFEAQRKAIAEKYGERFVDNVAFYTKDNVFYLPEESRWSYIIGQAKQDDIALKIDTALFTIEKANPALKGALPDNYILILQNSHPCLMRLTVSIPTMQRMTLSVEFTNTSSASSLLRKVRGRESSTPPSVSLI